MLFGVVPLEFVVPIVRLVLAGVFVVAGVAKLADRRGTGRMLADFGVPRTLGPVGAVLLPAAELACAVLLIPDRLAWWGAVSVLILLALFSTAIGINLALGRAPDCRCFGQIHRSRAGWTTLTRNVVLAAAAAYTIRSGPGDLQALMATGLMLTGRGLAQVPVWIYALIAAWFGGMIWLWWVMRTEEVRAVASHAATPASVPAKPDPKSVAPLWPLPEAKPQPEPEADAPNPIPLAIGAAAPLFTVSSLGGDVVTLDELASGGRPLLLLFTQPYCASCDVILQDVTRWQRELADRVLIVPISKSGIDANREKVRQHALADLWLQEGDQVGNAYGVQLFPTALVVEKGLIATDLSEGRDAIRKLIAKLKASAPPDSSSAGL